MDQHPPQVGAHELGDALRLPLVGVVALSPGGAKLSP